MRAADIVVPAAVAALIVFALFKKVNVYKAFVDGAADALPQLISILPYLAAMLTAIELFRSSGALDYLIKMLEPTAAAIRLDTGLIPIILLRPFSGSASLALLKDTLISYGPDSYTGRAASIIVGSTETVFYTVSVYFGAVGVTKTRHAIPAALIAGLAGTAAGILLA